jgi:hypothetical protein
MDKLEIKQGSFIQQTQYFIPVEINLSIIPARLRIVSRYIFFTRNKDLYNTNISYCNLCGNGSQHSNISKGKGGTYKNHWYARLQ